MRTNQRELLIYYNPESSAHRRTVAYAQSLSKYVRAYSFEKAPSTETSWQQILQALDIPPKELLNKAHPYYQQHIRGCEFDEACWLKVIQNNPDLIRAPIAMRGKRAIFCENATDILKLIEEVGIGL
ncbi:MAG: glutaredoxin [Saprospirales bacterium]|nr:glutaredoxin [Saprospirales bacterium]MBK8491572.1 glutaredoxin [Saprospirales bacterium]